MRPFRIVFGLVLTCCVVRTLGAGSHKHPPATRPANGADVERMKWESAIVFFGDEETGDWSLRIRDQDVDRDRRFEYRELWQFDWPSKKWVRIDATPTPETMRTAEERRQTKVPGESPEQILMELPIEKDQMGLFYAKWTVDDVRGATFFRIGPGLRQKTPLAEKPPPDGMILGIVPLDLNHTEAAYIPNPRIACEKPGK